jgi:hypothetical protein
MACPARALVEVGGRTPSPHCGAVCVLKMGRLSGLLGPVPSLVNNRVGRILWVPEDFGRAPRLLTGPPRSRRSNMILAAIANSGYTTDN